MSKDKDVLLNLLKFANKEIKSKLEGGRSVINRVVSPTTIEDFYKCPYRAFASHTLKIKQKDNGEIGPLTVGNFIHAVLEIYVLRLSEIKDKNTSNQIFEECLNQVLSSDEYLKFKIDKVSDFTLNQVIEEAKEFCYKTYLQFKDSLFKPYKTEATFGDSNDLKTYDFPAIKLTDKVKLTGKIDRIDTFEGYYRVLDYKTGKVKDKDSELFSGVKLQLYLYAQAVKNLTLAGAYYVPISNEYLKDGEEKTTYAVGKTLQDEKVVFATDSNLKIEGKSKVIGVTYEKEKVKKAVSQDAFCAYTDYAMQISKLGAKQMTDGVIIPSPIESACAYCGLKGLCGVSEEYVRKIKKVTQKTIEESIKGDN